MADLDNDQVSDVEVGIIGSGSMGAGMALLFAEHGSRVGIFDLDAKAVKQAISQAKEDEAVDESKVHGFTSLDKLVAAFPKGSGADRSKPRILVLSLPHGKPVDGIMDTLLPRLEKGDVVIDAGNEFFENTQRRQGVAAGRGIHWVGMGVSGGYQAARHGPSMSPGCTTEAYMVVEPYLKKWAAKTDNGESCVEHMGPGGCGHYVKMIHNGIEHAHLSVLCEVRSLLYSQLGYSNDEISYVFEQWNRSGPLRGNYLVGIGYKGLRFKEGDGIEDEQGIVQGIEDKVTQDVDGSEGTGTWSTREAAARHVAAPAMAAAHDLRIISANKGLRLKVAKNIDIPQPSSLQPVSDKKHFEAELEQAVYGCVLAGFVQGLDIIAAASHDEGWGVKLSDCIKIWRAGYAISEMLYPLLEPFGPSQPHAQLESLPKIAKELQQTYRPMKKLYAMAIEADAVAPALGATLEYLKSVGGKNLPTDFQEMELDYFGWHSYDIKGQTEPGANKGKHHTEFQSTRGMKTK